MFFSFLIFVDQVFTSPYRNYNFGLAFLLGLILISINRGIDFDKEEDSFRIYFTICWLKLGRWHRRNDYHLKLKYKQKASIKTYGAFRTSGSVQEFELVLVGKNELSIKKFNDYKDAKDFSRKVSFFLNIPIVKKQE